jgi:hypothetical protein
LTGIDVFGEAAAAARKRAEDRETIGDTGVVRGKLMGWFNQERNSRQSLISKLVQTLNVLVITN